ncbi:AAA family ATPase [Nannocystis sp. SCPEA4]|uniref:ATP-dependent nuclease n=1 Tax=Nannocystis sp. SCPEA4 TaxID=2996787 RepID=UPI00226F5103|nr:AAA family ATPase [Nannocystis sp. SCPEA4]MCY1057265.1 AAA family ATPase [Nannocystis sp. SCPEA4]
MISDLLLNFRHLQGLELRNLAAVNIIVGPNNVGKTTLFRGIQKAALDMDNDNDNKDGDDDDDSDSDSTLRIGSPIPEDCASILHSANFPSHINHFWTDTPHKFQRHFWTGDDGKIFRHSEDRLDSRHSGILRSGGPRESQRSWTFDISKAKRIIARLAKVQRNWLVQSYYLWHRRKSHYTEILGAHHDRLDSEAEHLAARLDHVLSGLEGGRQRTRIDQFMNSVIPDIGGVGINRKRTDDSTEISVVFQDGKAVRSLEDLGGGVEQVLALALVLLAEPDEGAVFIEEPESHLHESAQRRLIEQIRLHRGNRQVFLATHSPIFVNEFDGANVYRLTRNPETKITLAYPCLSKPQQRQLLDELGVLPSSLTQTNCVIWVEGPTEVRLVTHWLALVAPDLVVNQHYAFAQTGGSNIVSLAADLAPASPEEWMQDINRICRHNYFICDRDAGVGQDPAKEPVRNIATLVGENHWITHGYEIEWYLPDVAIAHLWGSDAAEHMRPHRGTAELPFYEALKASKIRGTATAGDRKSAHAERIVKQAFGSDVWFEGPAGEDLRVQLTRLVDFIRHANQLQSRARPLP